MSTSNPAMRKAAHYAAIAWLCLGIGQAAAQEPPPEALNVPGARVTLPVSVARAPFDKGFVDEARQYFSNFHMQLGGDHALYYTTHLSEFIPAALAMPKGEVRALARRPLPEIGAVTFTLEDDSISQPLDVYIHDESTRVTGIMILQGGDVVYEAYPGIEPERQHMWASVSKSAVGTLLTMLEDEGRIDTSRPITDYVSELRGSEWDSVPLIDAMNMASGLDIAEDAEATMNPRSVFQRMLAADFGVPNSDGEIEDEFDVLRGAEQIKGEAAGEVARYSSVICKVLVAVIENVTGRTFTSYFEERIWSKIGARAPAAVSISPQGLAIGYGLINSRLDDLARYALLFTPSWDVVSDEKIVAPHVLRTMQTGGSEDAYLAGDFTDHSWLQASLAKDMPLFNSHQWDAVWTDGALFKHGNLYQGIYVDPARDVVAVYFSTSPVYLAPDLLPGYLRAAAKHLAGGGDQIGSHPEATAIKAAVYDYFEGINQKDRARLESAFDASAQLKSPDGDGAVKLEPIADAINRWMSGEAQPRTGKILKLDITDGQVAQVVFDFDGTFIDFLTLLKIDGQWKIVDKVFVPQ